MAINDRCDQWDFLHYLTFWVKSTWSLTTSMTDLSFKLELILSIHFVTVIEWLELYDQSYFSTMHIIWDLDLQPLFYSFHHNYCGSTLFHLLMFKFFFFFIFLKIWVKVILWNFRKSGGTHIVGGPYYDWISSTFTYIYYVVCQLHTHWSDSCDHLTKLILKWTYNWCMSYIEEWRFTSLKWEVGTQSICSAIEWYCNWTAKPKCGPFIFWFVWIIIFICH